MFLGSCFALTSAETTFFDHEGLSPTGVVEYLPDSMQSIYPLIAPQQALAVFSKDPRKEVFYGKKAYSILSSASQPVNYSSDKPTSLSCVDGPRFQLLELGNASEKMEPIIPILGVIRPINQAFSDLFQEGAIALCVGKDGCSDSLIAGACTLKSVEQPLRLSMKFGPNYLTLCEQNWISAGFEAISPKSFTSSLKQQYDFACSILKNQKLPVVKKLGENFSGAIYLTVYSTIDSLEKRYIL